MDKDKAMKPKTIAFEIPMVPPSVNHYIKHTRSGRHYVSREAKDFKLAVKLYSHNKTIRAAHYGVNIDIYLGAKQKGDIDNFPKCVLDGLVEAGIIDSDAKITSLIVQKFRDIKSPRTCVQIWNRY